MFASACPSTHLRVDIPLDTNNVGINSSQTLSLLSLHPSSFPYFLFFLSPVPSSSFVLLKLFSVFLPIKGPGRGGTDWREALGRKETQGWKDVTDFPSGGSPTKIYFRRVLASQSRPSARQDQATG